MAEQHNNLHDKLFKDTFESAREVRALLTHFVDPKLYATLDLDTLHIENVSFIDEELKEYFADIIYSCSRKNGKKLSISILLEHKSYFDKGLPVQLLQYLTLGYRRQYQEDKSKKLDLILPILIYHGEKRWKRHELEDMTYLPEKELNPFLPTFQYEVIDLGKIAKEVIISVKNGAMLPKTFLLFKHKNDKEYILQNSAELFTFEYELDEEEKKRIIHALLKYVFELHRFEQEDAKKFIKKLDKMTQTIAGSYADTLRKEGRREGEIRGEIRGEIKGEIKGKIKADTLKSIKFLCFILKMMPHLSDAETARSADSSLEMAVVLRKLLKKHTVKTAGAQVLKTWFVEIELNEKDKAGLLQSVRDYYKKEPK